MSFKTLNIGVTSLMTSQLALDTVGHNISNAATEGYTRQRLMTEANLPDYKSFGAIGGGVGINSVSRVADEFLEIQVRDANSLKSYYEAQIDYYENIEAVFNELTDNDISTSLDKFWNAISDVNNHVEDVSTRRVLIEQAQVLADSFNSLDQKLFDMRERLNDNVIDLVGQANSLIDEISRLNKDIVKAECGGKSPVMANDSRDQRTQRLKELSSLLDITTTEEPNGAVVVAMKGRLLVFENEVFHLTTEKTVDDDLLIDTVVFETDGEEVNLGLAAIGAYVEMRDQILQGYKEDMDTLASTFSWEFNKIYSQGQGLKGFSEVTSSKGVIDTTVPLDELNFGFVPVGDTYQIKNGNFEMLVRNENTEEVTTVSIEIDLDDTGEPDTILYDPLTPPPADNNALVNKLQNALDAEFPGSFSVSVDNTGSLQIVSETNEYTFGFGRDSTGLMAAFGINSLFSGYDAGSMAVEQYLLDDPELLACSRTFEAGDTANSVALLQLRDTQVLDNNTSTTDDYYQGIIGRMGIEFAQSESLLETQEDILLRAENNREDLSGVNLDEELALMIQFQRTFQSSAKFISVADTLYETLINM